MEPYEEEILQRMYDQRIIGESGYARIQNIDSRIKWREIQARYQVKGRFKAVMRRLSNRGYIISKKGGEAYCLSRLGVGYVIGRQAQSSQDKAR